MINNVAQPSFAYLIEKKREAEEFSDPEVRYMIESILNNRMPDYQLAALIMAIYFRGLSAQETAVLTEEVMLSGEIIDLIRIGTSKIALYSVGGVSDKSHLVLAPLLAACGVVVPSMLGESEAFIFGDLTKLQAVPGFKSDLSIKSCIQQLKHVGCCFYSQPQQIVPVDQILNRIRRNTATMDSIPLIASSILSKCLASGAESLVVDVKCGNGSVLKNLDQAKQLANMITRTARLLQRRCVTLVTDMNQPLGNSIGTAFEIQEAIDLLKGGGNEMLRELVLKLGMEMVRLSGVSGSTLSAKKMIVQHLNDGSAFEKFKEMIGAQGGDVSYIDHPEKFQKSKHVCRLTVPKRGYVYAVNSASLAKGVDILMHPDNSGNIDSAVGLTDLVKVGTQVKTGDILMQIHYNDNSRLDTAMEYLRSAYSLAPKRPAVSDLFIERVA